MTEIALNLKNDPNIFKSNMIHEIPSKIYIYIYIYTPKKPLK